MAFGKSIRTYWQGRWHDGDLAVMNAADHGIALLAATRAELVGASRVTPARPARNVPRNAPDGAVFTAPTPRACLTNSSAAR